MRGTVDVHDLVALSAEDAAGIDPALLVEPLRAAAGLPLARGIHLAHDQGLPRSAITDTDLCHALAASLGAPPAGENISFLAAGGDAAVRDVLADLAGARGGEGSTGYSELAWIVACERKAARKRSGTVDLAEVDGAFHALYLRLNGKLIRFLRGRFAERDVEDVAQETWLSFCKAYLDASARSRFRCRSSILTALCGNATLLANKRRQKDKLEQDPLGGEDEPGLIDSAPASSSPSETEIHVLWSHLRACIEQLAGRQRLIAALRLCQRIPAVEIAKELNVGKAAISMAMARAREKIQPCLEARGVGPDWANLEISR